jgi:hypothetical protein
VPSAASFPISETTSISSISYHQATLTCFANPGHVIPKGFIDDLDFSQLLKVTTLFSLFSFFGEFTNSHARKSSLHCRDSLNSNSPAQDTQDEIHHEKRADDNQRNKVNPGPFAANGIVHLNKRKQSRRPETLDQSIHIAIICQLIRTIAYSAHFRQTLKIK